MRSADAPASLYADGVIPLLMGKKKPIGPLCSIIRIYLPTVSCTKPEQCVPTTLAFFYENELYKLRCIVQTPRLLELGRQKALSQYSIHGMNLPFPQFASTESARPCAPRLLAQILVLGSLRPGQGQSPRLVSSHWLSRLDIIAADILAPSHCST